MSTNTRRPIYSNPSARSWTSQPSNRESSAIISFHRSLPKYSPTTLHSLDAIAKEIGVKKVFLKDETSRLGLPSFKIVGASWGIHQAIAQRAGLPSNTTVEDLSTAAQRKGVKLFAATDGNHGRAVARMGRILGISGTKIFVPGSLDESTQDLISQEGAQVIVVDGDYDFAVKEADAQARNSGGILIQDTAFEGYTEIPQWIVGGYSTLLVEIDEQLPDHADVVVVPIGVGSLGEAVVSQSKMKGQTTFVLAVEPDTAACLYKSLRAGTSLPIRTSHTIQTGMNCGTVSTTAWPILKAGVDVSTTVSDFEVHEAVQCLQSVGIKAGPCGAAPLAGLRHVARTNPEILSLNEDSVVVLICTEGSRDYQIPRNLSGDDSVAKARNLVGISSSGNKTSDEKEEAKYVVAWLEHRGIEVNWLEKITN